MRYLKPWIVFGILGCSLAFAPQPLRAQVYTSAELSAPGEEQGPSARALALGSAYVAVPGDVSAMGFNPAALATVSSFQLGLHQQSWFGGFSEETLTFSFPLAWELGTGGLVLDYLNYGTFPGRDTNGDPASNYQSYRLSTAVGWGATVLPNLSVGLTGRVLQQTIGLGSFNAIALDLGGLYRILPELYVGASYIDWGTYVGNFLLASRFEAGASYAFRAFPGQQALACLSFTREQYNDTQLHLGLEDELDKFLALRTGYQWDYYDNELAGLHGLSVGLGFHLKALDLDYAYLLDGDLGSTQRVSLQYDFGGQPIPPAKKSAAIRAVIAPAPTPSPNPTGLSPTSSPAPTGTPLATPTATPTPIDNLNLYFTVPEESGSDSLAPDVASEIQRLNGLIQSDPKDYKPWMDLGRLYFKTGQKASAIQCFEQVLRLNPDALALRDWLEKYQGTEK